MLSHQVPFHEPSRQPIQSTPTTEQQKLQRPPRASKASLANRRSYHDFSLDSNKLSADSTLFDRHSSSPVSFGLTPPPELMQSEPWMVHTQRATPDRSTTGRFSHHRESSLSSLGSAGPASPFHASTVNPQIAVTDSALDRLHGLQPDDYQQFFGLASKPLATPHGPSCAGYPGYMTVAHVPGAGDLPMGMAAPRTKQGRGLLPAPDLPRMARRSNSASVPSSVGGDSPATPSTGEPDGDVERRRGRVAFEPDTGDRTVPADPRPTHGSLSCAPPKLDRTMTDVYGDELYSPDFSISSTSPPHAHISNTSPFNDLFAQRLRAANSQHLGLPQSPISSASRDRSPFRHGSPLAPSPMHDFPSQTDTVNSVDRRWQRTGSARPERAPDSTDPRHGVEGGHDEFKTISPKDAILDFPEADSGANYSLFPESEAALESRPQVDHDGREEVPDVDSVSDVLPSQLPTVIAVPQQYPFVSRHRYDVADSPSRSAISTESSRTSVAQRPMHNAAESGTYTCTYHGCTQRFETPTLLQKHKREGHRQAPGHVPARGGRLEAVGMTSSLLNSQAGPHRCDRINPSTNKPCNTVFSRPYDLTRHEDTIHNARKKKVRCDLCTEDKTFSRADALTRHYRVCHPDVEVPVQQRRRVL